MIILILRDVLLKMADIFTDLRRKNGEEATFPPDIKEFCPMNGPCGLYVLDLFTKPNPIYHLPPNLPPFTPKLGYFTHYFELIGELNG